MYVYWKEECKICIQREDCPHKEDVKEFKQKLTDLENKFKNVSGSLKFNCDHFSIDENIFKASNSFSGDI